MLDPYKLKLIKHINKNPGVTTEQLCRKFGENVEAAVNELDEANYIRNPSPNMRDWDIWHIDHKGINEIIASRMSFFIRLKDHLVTALVSFLVGVAVGLTVARLTSPKNSPEPATDDTAAYTADDTRY